MTQTHNNKRLQVEEYCDGECLVCEADRFAIGQVFRNILENALDAAPDESLLKVRGAVVRGEGLPALRISFQDQGPGIPAAQRQRIFEPFFTTKTKGTGLGMAIARRIVESHGGQLAVGAPSDGGAEIIVTLPQGNL